MKKIKINGESFTALKLHLMDELLKKLFQNEVLNKSFPETKILYHYTTLAGCIGIIENQSIFSTHIYFLNDKRELKHGIDLITEASFSIKDISEDIFNLLTKEFIEEKISSEQYVTCFSKKGDLLGQWRAYSNNGMGVSIGFDFLKLTSCLDANLHYNHVQYNKEIQIDTIVEITKLIISFFEEKKELFEWDNYNYHELVASTIISFLGTIIIHYKDPSFIEEDEYRLMYDLNNIPDNDIEVKFRAKDNLIIPYIELETEFKRFSKEKQSGMLDDLGADPTFIIKKIPIKEIIIGPSLDFDTIKQGIEKLLYKHQYNDVEIKQSNIPYRI